MPKRKHGQPFEPNKNLKLLPHINHYFLTVPPQSANEVALEYGKSQKQHGILVLHYVSSGAIRIRVCHTYFSRINSETFEIAAFNYYRKKNWRYYGFRIYKIKFIPMVNLDGSAWPQEQQTAFISYFFNLGKANNISSERIQQVQIIRAFSGKLFERAPKIRGLKGVLLARFFSL
ncbi:hypothetical protein LGR51_19485 [Pseudomonas sp. NP21570]|uniref:hypothetical protein n=1 Tax=Stutzerimonas kunmingensis TaxID=1211807 RepID=UPI001E2E91A3|nr:hypothetical protein [Stutzerimonas kunmingensis]MCB4796685.1 hypothetical protein [Pseudomonas sp. NP21570]